MNKDLKKRIKEKHRPWFKFKYFSPSNAGYRTELQEQYRTVSKELKPDISREIIKFESNLAKNSKTDPKILYSYIRSKQLTNNRITTLTSDSGEDLSTPADACAFGVKKTNLDRQHGFVSSKECVTNLIECIDLTTNALNKHRKLDVLYADFMKAFDKISHLKLIHKLKLALVAS